MNAVEERDNDFIIDVQKAKYLAENVFPQNFKSMTDIINLLEKQEIHEDFITDEAGLYTLIANAQDFEIHAYFDLVGLIERRYEGVKEAVEDVLEPQKDERYYTTGLYEVDIINENGTKAIFLNYLCSSPSWTLTI